MIRKIFFAGKRKADDRVMSTLPNAGQMAYQRLLALHKLPLNNKSKRDLYAFMRYAGGQLNVHTLFPLYGMTAGEFAVHQVLNGNHRKSTALVLPEK